MTISSGIRSLDIQADGAVEGRFLPTRGTIHGRCPPSFAEMIAPRISIVLPVRDEPDNIGPCLERLEQVLAGADYEVLVCYDFDEDTTLAAIERAPTKPKRLILVKNDLGRGPSYAMRAGIARASGDVVVTSMADLSDPPEVILAMARKIRDHGAAVVSGSRYMSGGDQRGGPPLKSALSRAAGISLHLIAGVSTRDSTTNFRAYGRQLLEAVQIESGGSFSLGLELTVKAHVLGFTVDEVPSTWLERSHGESRFRIGPWLPEYLRFYFRAARAPLAAWTVWLGTALASTLIGGPLFPVVMRSALAGVAVLAARKLRGKNTLLDASLPVIAHAPLPVGPPSAALARIAAGAALLVLAKRRGMARPWIGTR